MTLPAAPIALTIGEPAGVGPDLVPLAWETLRGELDFVLLGDPDHLPKGTAFECVNSAAEATHVMPDAVPVLPMDFGAPRQPGQAVATHAPHVVEAIARAVALVQSGEASAVCTAPIHKKALKDGAGFAFPGHTEYLAHLAGASDVVMMLACEQLRVVPATIHIPLCDVPACLTRESLEQTIRITHADLQSRFGIAAPRIAVAGLNPHAGEGGAMGMEEIDMIAPLLDDLRAQGLDITGPLPADTMFHPAARARYDVAICMYHDQALIPAKMLGFDDAVNVTLGLPFIRTSPDHGTAFDIAGKGVARPSSLIAALKMAAEMAANRATAT